jgi:hypothetical protein
MDLLLSGIQLGLIMRAEVRVKSDLVSHPTEGCDCNVDIAQALEPNSRDPKHTSGFCSVGTMRLPIERIVKWAHSLGMADKGNAGRQRNIS